MSVSRITEPALTIGEGPHWDEATQSLLYVDINAGDIHKWNSVTQEDTKIHVGGTVGFVVPRKSGGYVIGHNRALVNVDWETQETKVFGEVDIGTKNRFNDGKCDAAGRVWAGTMGHEEKPATVTPEQGSLYRLDIDDKVTKHLDKISISNGLAWSADNSVMYYIDSIPRKVYSFNYDITTGSISNQQVAVDFGGKETIPTLGFPDGMTIDTDGKLWIACFYAGKVIRFDPETGKHIQAVEIPAKRTTSCCFGGKDYDELYVTSSQFAADEEELKATPFAGACYRVTGLGVRGTAPHVFEG